jgi:hypothetical protein
MQTRIAKQVVLLSALLLSSGAHSQTVGNRQGAAALQDFVFELSIPLVGLQYSEELPTSLKGYSGTTISTC